MLVISGNIGREKSAYVEYQELAEAHAVEHGADNADWGLAV